MVRPAIPDEAKRKQVGVRLSPRDRERIAKLADEHGNSLGAEVEQLALDQLAYLEGVPKETRELLERIAAKIAEMEDAAKGRWFKNLKAWAAVSQALQTIIDQDRPERAFDDEFFRSAMDTTHRLEGERREAVASLARIGVAVNEEPNLPRLLGEMRHRGIFGNALARPTRSSRDWERAAVEAMPDGDDKQAARMLFGHLCELDVQIAAAHEDEMEKFRPYFEAEEEGRRIGGRKPVPNALAGYMKDN